MGRAKNEAKTLVHSCFTPGLGLVIGGVTLATAATLDEAGLCALVNRQCAVVDPLLDEGLPLLLDLVTRHLCAGHDGQPLGGDTAQQQTVPQHVVLLVLQVEDPGPDLVLVLGVGRFEIVEDRLLQARGQILAPAEGHHGQEPETAGRFHEIVVDSLGRVIACR